MGADERTLRAFIERDALAILRGEKPPLILYSDKKEKVDFTLNFMGLTVEWNADKESPVKLLCKTEVRDAKGPSDIKEQEVLVGALAKGAEKLKAPAAIDPHFARIVAAWKKNWKENVAAQEDVELSQISPRDIVPSLPLFQLLGSYCLQGPAPARPTGRLSAEAAKSIANGARFRPLTAKEKKLLEGVQSIQAFDWSERQFLLTAGALEGGRYIEAHEALWLVRDSKAPVLVFFIGWDGQDPVHHSALDGDTSRAIGRALHAAVMKSPAAKKKVKYLEGDLKDDPTDCQMSLAEWLQFDLLADAAEVFDWRIQGDIFDAPMRSGFFLKPFVPVADGDRDELVALFETGRATHSRRREK